MMQRQAEAVLAQTAQPVARAEIAVVVPYYKAEPMLDMLIERLSATLSQITANWNVIFVDDRSPDNGWQKIVAASLRDPRLKGIRLSRNFGQHAAITAGMHHVNANWYVVMDCDLQDRPEDIEILYRRACEGTADVVLAERATAGLSMQRTAASFVFNAMVKWMAALDFSNKIGNFRIFSDKVAQAFRAYPEQMRFFPALMSEVGFASERVLLERQERPIGPSSYNFRKLFHLAFDSAITYSDRPLRYLAAAGVLLSVVAFFLGMWVALRAMFSGVSVAGWASLMTMVLFFGGVQVFATSLVGVYVGKVFKESKNRPLFIVDEQTGVA